MSFTWEIYGDSTAAFEDCFKMFNPLGKEHFEEVVTLWTKALLQLLELLPSHPSTWPVFKHAGLDKLGGTDAYVTGGHAHGSNQAAPALGTAEDSTMQKQQQQQQGVVSGGLTGSENDNGGVGDDDDGDAQPQQEGSLWRQPEVEDDITTDTDRSPASDRPPSVAAAGITTTQQVESVQPEQQQQQQIQQQQQQQQQQSGQHASTALKDMQQEVGLQVIGGDSISKAPSLLHGSKVLPLLVGMGGLAALALYLAR
jgi:hypothetical protein